MGDVVLLSESLEALLDLQATVAQPVTHARAHTHTHTRTHTHTHTRLTEVASDIPRASPTLVTRCEARDADAEAAPGGRGRALNPRANSTDRLRLLIVGKPYISLRKRLSSVSSSPFSTELKALNGGGEAFSRVLPGLPPRPGPRQSTLLPAQGGGVR